MKKIYAACFLCFVGVLLFISGKVVGQSTSKTPQFEVNAPQSGCAPTVVSFFNKSHTFYDTLHIKYKWYLNSDANPFFIGYNPPPQSFNVGNYNIRVEADSAGKNLGFNWKNFTLTGKPTKFLPDNNAQYCPNEEVTFRITDNVSDMYWDFGDGPVFDGTNKNNWVRHVYKNAGTYHVKVYYNHICGSDTLKQDVVITPTAKPTVYASIWGDWKICINDEATFGTDDKYTAYQWSFGDGSASQDPNPKHSYSVMKDYPVIVTAKNSCGNTGTDTVHVSVTNNQKAWAQFNYWFEGSNCPNSPVKFNANGSGLYQWSFGDGGTSNLRSPSNTYADTGKYKVRLVVTNGCGSSDTAFNYVQVMVNQGMQPPMPYIMLQSASNNNNNNTQSPSDTLKVCPGEKVIFKNSNGDSGSKYKWELGDGYIFTGQSGEHTYANAGIYTVKLTLTNDCKSSVFATRIVKIDRTIRPLVNLKAIPRQLCPGEKVFYFDDGNHSDNPVNKYFIDFGDGTSLNNITKSTDTTFQTLATHPYPNTGSYNFKFVASNTCGNKDSIFGTIAVNTSPKVPFYYLDNSTTLQKDGMADWSTRKMPFDSKFVIPVRWDAWPGIDSTLTAFFFWGQFDPTKPDAAGDPAGFVRKKIKNIATDGVDTIVAYIPYDITRSDSVGMAVAWYCNHIISDGMPNAFVTAVKNAAAVKSIKVIPSGTVDFGVNYAPGIVFPANAFNGKCTPNVQGTWNFKITDNDFYLLDMHNGQFNLVQAPQPNFYTNNILISKGNYSVKGDTVMFFDANCGNSSAYKFQVTGNKLTMYMMSETCSPRSSVLNQKVFVYTENNQNQNDRIGCPGDVVKFMLAGGINVQWDFGDGSAKGSGPIAFHKYPNVGTYTAKAIATNMCNRIDTMLTVVRIGATNLPNADNIDIDKYWAPKGDTIHFKYWGNNGGDSKVDNNKYVWEFGDGSKSSVRFANHAYQLKGGYDIKLSVTNGCGTSMAMRHVEVGNAYDNCSLLAKYIIQKADTAKLYPNIPVKFMNASSGIVTKYSWNFNDGMLDTAANPSHSFAKPGYYNVCLSVYNDSTKCSDQICMNLLVGTQPCKAEYMFVANNTTNTVQFTDKSYKATRWNWDYKDGKIDTIQNPTHQYTKPGIYEVCLVTYDRTSNCQSKMCQVIPVGQIDSTKYCKAEYSFFVDNSALQVSFKNQSIGKILKGYWDLGDGYFAYEENPVHKYVKPGLYHVCGSIVDSAGCQSQVCKDIQVGTMSCNADFGFFVDPTTRQVNFTNNDLGKNLKYYWDFGDGQSSVSSNPVNTYKQAGTYKVGHIIIDTISRCRSDKSMEIAVGQVLCAADFAFMIDPATRSVKFALTSDSSVRKQWNFGDGGTDTLVRPIHQYQKDGMYQVCVNIYNPINKCVANRCMSIPVYSQPTGALLDADYAYMVDPATLKAQFNDKSTGKVKRYYWDFGDGLSDTTANPLHTYTKAGQYKVCEFVADSTKNVSQECKDVVVKTALCKADFNFFVTPGTLTTQLTDLSSASIKEHYWDLGDGKFSNKKDVLTTYAQAGNYKVCKTILDSTNCKASVCKDVQLGTLACKAGYTFFVDAATRNVKFTDQSAGGITSYFWDFGDGSFSNIKDVSHIYQKPGIYNVCQSVKNTTTGCTATMCQMVQVGSVTCDADFTYLVDALTRTITLQNASKGDVKRFYWNNGSGGSDTLENTKFTYTADGNYNVCLQVFNPLTGCKSNICKNIAVIRDTAKLVRFAADFSYFMVIDSNKVVLNDKSTGDPTQWYWTFGDGAYEKLKSTSHIFKTAGTYKICHSIYKASTGDFNENCKEISIGTAPCNLIAGYTKFIDNKTQTIYLSDNSQGTTQKWFWMFGDGTTSQKQNPTHMYTKPGYYLVSLAIRDTVKKCTDYIADMVQIGTVTCKALFDYTVDMTSNKLTLKNTSSGNVAKYYWEFGDRATSVETNPVYTYGDAGYYKVLLVAASSDLTCKDYYSQSIQVGTINCSAAFEYYVDSVSNKVFFKNKSLGTSTKYNWFFGDGFNSGLQNPDHKYVAPGYYKVGLNTYNSANGCMDYNEQVILVGSEGIDCQADYVYQIDESTRTGKFFDQSKGKNLKYRWNYGDRTPVDTAANASHTFALGGYYNVCLSVFAPNGIQNTNCKTVKVAPPTYTDCFTDFTFSVDSTTKTVNFTDKSVGGLDTWNWDFGDNGTSTVKSPSHVYAAAGYYKVILAGKNQTSGCAKATAKLINVSDVYALRTIFSYGLDSTKLKTSGFPVNFVGLSSGDAAKYVWDFGDGTKDSTAISPTHVYAAAGTYNVCLKASDPVTNQSNTYCYQIKAGPTAVNSLVSPDECTLKAYPTPYNDVLNVEYSTVSSGDYEIVVRDLQGRILDVVAKGIKNAGDYKLVWEGTSISSGVYYLQLLNKGNVIKTITIIKAK